MSFHGSSTVSCDDPAGTCQASPVLRRVLVISDPKADAQNTGPVPGWPTTPRGLQVDHRGIEVLGLGCGCRAPADAAASQALEPRDDLAIFSMLSRYQLILVPDQNVRASLCDLMPSLAHQVFALDCFDGASREEAPTPRPNGHPEPPAHSFEHWSTFLSSLAA